MSPKADTQSNTLLNAAQSSAATKAFKRVSLSPTKEKLFFKISRPSKKFLKPDHTKLTPTDITPGSTYLKPRAESQQVTACKQDVLFWADSRLTNGLPRSIFLQEKYCNINFGKNFFIFIAIFLTKRHCYESPK